MERHYAPTEPYALLLASYRSYRAGHRADLNLPADPLLAEEDAAFQNYPTSRAMPPIQHRLVSVARATTLSPYAHGQNAARRGKHVQACPFDTGTVDWRQWRDGFRAAFGRTE
jgi:hypothetical protein